MKVLRFLILTLPFFMLAGCFDVETVVRVRSDGSGVVEERMLMGGELIAMARQMQAASGEPTETNTLYKREELEDRAKAMGPGVSLVSVEPLVGEEREGYVAVYAFPDINKLVLNQNPGDKAPSGAGMQNEGAGKENEPVTCRSPGSPGRGSHICRDAPGRATLQRPTFRNNALCHKHPRNKSRRGCKALTCALGRNNDPSVRCNQADCRGWRQR